MRRIISWLRTPDSGYGPKPKETRDRILVQVQSSWFPLYDRNPQTFVPNIFEAKPADYVKATQRIYHAPGAASFIELPVVAARQGTQPR